jgi:hypothetical protein
MKILKYNELIKEANKYWAKTNIENVKKDIKLIYAQYFKDLGIMIKPLYKINTIGSYNTEKFVNDKSDIDFTLNVLAEVDKEDMIQIVDYINNILIDKYGEIEGKGGKYEVIGINGKFWWDK